MHRNLYSMLVLCATDCEVLLQFLCIAVHLLWITVQLLWILGPVALVVTTIVVLMALFWMDFIPNLSNEQMHRLKANDRPD